MHSSNNSILSSEIEDLIIADLALTVAFTMVLSGGIFGADLSIFLYLLPISFVAVSFSFVLHELMHKFIAQHFGAVAAFRRSDNGILITLMTSALGFLVGLPGATVIYASHFTKNEEGYVSIAGPLTNFAVFAIFLIMGSLLFPSFSKNIVLIFNSNQFIPELYLQNVFSFTVFTSIYLAFFNMLPLYPLDGSKVFRWNKPVYFSVMVLIFILLIVIIPLSSIIFSLIFILIMALIMSSLSKGFLF
ncbi:MAG: site-2 protease family protein [Candidatus Micrarchaeales archaeon]